MSLDQYSIIESTLREGEQFANAFFKTDQKVTIARWVAGGVKTLLCFDPTRGIDIRTKQQIYVLLRELAEAGAAVLLYTSDLKEIPLACDRAIVIFGGRVVSEIDAASADETALLRAAYNLRSDALMPEDVAAEAVAGAVGAEVAGPLPGMVGDSRYEARELKLARGEKIVLATFPLLANLPKAELLFNIVFFIVITSALFQGWSTPQVARLLKVADSEPPRVRAMEL